MAFRIYQFDGINEVNHFLQGGLTGGKIPVDGIRGLVGKTITFTTPAGSCTFVQGAGPDPDSLLFKDIKAQMEAAIAGLRLVLFAQQTIGFIQATPTAAVALPVTEQAARAMLGLPKSGIISGKFVLASTEAGTPRLDHVAGGPETQFILYVWE